MGCRTSVSPVICSVRHHDYSVRPSVPEFRSPYVSCFQSSFCFMFPFLFAISIPFYFRTPNPDRDICPILITLICSLWYLYVPILMYVPQSEIDIDCPSNSLSEPPNLRSVSRPKFEDSRRLVAQHISWSRVLAKNIEPRYALGPSPALTSWRLWDPTIIEWWSQCTCLHAYLFIYSLLDSGQTLVLQSPWKNHMHWKLTCLHQDAHAGHSNKQGNAAGI